MVFENGLKQLCREPFLFPLFACPKSGAKRTPVPTPCRDNCQRDFRVRSATEHNNKAHRAHCKARHINNNQFPQSRAIKLCWYFWVRTLVLIFDSNYSLNGPSKNILKQLCREPFLFHFLLVQKVAQKGHRSQHLVGTIANVISGSGPLLNITTKSIERIAKPGILTIINFLKAALLSCAGISGCER